MSRSESSKENGQSHTSSTILTDESGRSLSCYIEHSVEVNDKTYVLLTPIDTPVEIFAWQAEDEDDEPIPISEEEVDTIFDTAKAVLEEQNLTLKRSAITLTVSGDLPEFTEEEISDDELGEAAEYEELQWLASFYHEEAEYAIYSPLDPVFILARLNEDGNPELLSDEELQELEPMMSTLEGMIEERLFEELE
ncbi:DUF3727 domain-containing protein [Phormidium pseudopriestleyi FRX01]|uniref:DUF3727 domain-containing protein n=1 Tax=Phormidium pseudopriestleyi FRX01 TaxID=1759528 RepID=A0ABS3FLA6_9CYAN|nr:DUF3727 domain-containing protein [Phormidium pseudopriestleyi]MBO0347879.1 DUF3727 domain-containing protein [Phormidium pseudopriestleyi FRX01]